MVRKTSWVNTYSPFTSLKYADLYLMSSKSGDKDDVNKPRYTVSLYLGLLGAEAIEATRLQQTVSSSPRIKAARNGDASISCMVHAFENDKTTTSEVWSVLGEQAFKDGAVGGRGLCAQPS